MKKKYITLMLALAGLVGCRGNDAQSSGDKDHSFDMPKNILQDFFRRPEKQEPKKDTAFVMGVGISNGNVIVSAMDKDGGFVLARHTLNAQTAATQVGDTVLLTQTEQYKAWAVNRNLSLERRAEKYISSSRQR